MTKYRIRLSDGRVIGPFLKDQLFELRAKGHLKGKEEVQIFPTGNWGRMDGLEFFDELMSGKQPEVNSVLPREDTFVIDLTQLRRQKAEKEIEEELQSYVKTPEPLTETLRLTEDANGSVQRALDEIILDIDQAESVAVHDEEGLDVGDKTALNPIAQKELAKLRQKTSSEEEIKKAEEQKKAEEELRRKQDEELAIQLKEEVKDDSTHMIKLDIIKGELLEVASEEEAVINKAAKEISKKRAEQEALEDSENDDEEAEDGGRKKKKKLFILVVAACLGYAILFPDPKSEKPPFKFVPPEVVFPVPYDKADAKASTVNFEKGRELFAKGGYVNLVKAGIFFKNSYENNLQNKDALNLLVRTYAEELKYSKEKMADAQILFNLIQSKRPTLMSDPNGAIGLNIFYMTINKYEAAVDVTAKYLKLYPKNITQDLFAVYLRSLIKVGKLEVAGQIYKALEKAPDKNRYVFEALIEYLMLNQESVKAEEYVNEAIKKYPELVNFYLTKADMALKKNDLKELEANLRKAEELNLEYNDVNRAKFLELSGLLWAAKGNVEKATTFISASLNLEDSNSLRMRLANLETNNTGKAVDKIIAESKAVKLLNQARDFYEKRSYELALSSAARASDVYPGHIPSELFLARVQLRLGLAEQAIKTLEELLKKYPDNKDVNFAMIEAFVDTYKFNDAKNRIAIVAGMEIRNNWEFASLNAKLYSRMGDSLQTVSWLKASINMNPLNDKDVFHLAETYIKRHSFDAAQLLLNKAMELDPVNPDYRIAYAKIIYERQDDQAAVGYLLGLLEEFGENPKFLSEIAIFYYRSGRVKDFMAYKEKLQKLPNKDKSLYEFMIKAALLDERYNEIPALVEQLLAIEPGDLESMMTAGRVLFENGKLTEAALWFKRIQEKLPTYPKVQYYIARIKMLAGEIDDPKDAQGNPVKDGKNNVILGAQNLIIKDMKENGENDTSLVLLAEIHTQKGELIEAENLYKKAQKINPRSYEAMVGMADISTRRNNFDIALDLYKRAMNQKSDEPVLHRKVGDVYRLLGQGALAMESYKMYLEMAPDASDKAQIESYINLMQ